MFRIGLRIHRERLQAGLNDFLPDTGFHRKFCDLSRGGLTESKSFLHALRGVRKSCRRIIEGLLMRGTFEKIDDSFSRRVYADRDTLDFRDVNSFVEDLGSEAHDLNTRLRNRRTPFAGTDRDPNEWRNAVCKFVKGER
jgi:hypothetical protein